jgi:hypothetical protein
LLIPSLDFSIRGKHPCHAKGEHARHHERLARQQRKWFLCSQPPHCRRIDLYLANSADIYQLRKVLMNIEIARYLVLEFHCFGCRDHIPYSDNDQPLFRINGVTAWHTGPPVKRAVSVSLQIQAQPTRMTPIISEPEPA